MFCQDWWEVTEATTIASIEVRVQFIFLEALQRLKDKECDQSVKGLGNDSCWDL